MNLHDQWAKQKIEIKQKQQSRLHPQQDVETMNNIYGNYYISKEEKLICLTSEKLL